MPFHRTNPRSHRCAHASNTVILASAACARGVGRGATITLIIQMRSDVSAQARFLCVLLFRAPGAATHHHASRASAASRTCRTCRTSTTAARTCGSRSSAQTAGQTRKALPQATARARPTGASRKSGTGRKARRTQARSTQTTAHRGTIETAINAGTAP